MKKGIKDLAYLIKEAVKNKAPKPIVFLGAGASVSGGIPLASGIIEKILKDFEDNPAVINLEGDKKSDYYELMSALTPKQRRALFQTYIKEAKVNIAHIYLAQLIQEGYVDYVLTVNFDDLLLRAAGLFNYTLPTYDISNVNSFTTTTFQEESIIYLHGQHYGEWLLNSKGELDKVKTPIKSLFDKICHDRTWIIVGYSGEDEVFDCIKNFSSFDNELYWVGYLDNEPPEEVKKGLLNIQTKNAHLISGYDADTFFLDLHSKLGLETPKIMNKPFSFLQDMMKEIKEPEEKLIIEEHKELYKGVSERMKITNQWVHKAIEEIENIDSIEKFKQKIIDAILNGDFNHELALHFEYNIIEKKYYDAKEILSGYFNNWGNLICEMAEINQDEKFFLDSFHKYEKAIQLYPHDFYSYNNWGTAISSLAQLKKDDNLFIKSFKKFEKSIEINPDNYGAYLNWANAISRMAKKNNDQKKFLESLNKYKKANQFSPKNINTYNNWGLTFLYLARLNNDEKLFLKSFEKFKEAIKINPKYDICYVNWGSAILSLAKLNNDESLFHSSFNKLKIAIQINSKNNDAYNNLSSGLLNFYQFLKKKNKEDYKILEEAKEKALLAYKYGSGPYNLSCVYALLEEKENALKYLKETIDKKQVTKKHILEDKEWETYLEDEDFKNLVSNY